VRILTPEELASLAARSEWHGDKTNGIEIRHNEDGTVDEVCVYVDGQCVAHIEQMSEKSWWMGFYTRTHEAHVNFFGKKKGVTCRAEGWPASTFTCHTCGKTVSLFDSTIQDYQRVCREHVASSPANTTT